MSRIYYPVRYRLDHKDRYLIWYTKDGSPEAPDDDPVIDGFIIDETGQIPVFRTLAGLYAYVNASGLTPFIEDGLSFTDFDTVATRMRRRRPKELPCKVFLNAWNLLADISETVNGNFDPDFTRTRTVYNKFFWGSNLPPVTPKGKHYDPQWSADETWIIRDVLGKGIRMFRDYIAMQPDLPSGPARQ